MNDPLIVWAALVGLYLILRGVADWRRHRKEMRELDAWLDTLNKRL